MRTFAFEDHAGALAVLQLHKTVGENDALWENTASALHACCHGHPEWLIINGAGAAVTTLQKPMTMKIRCASGIAGEYCGGMNWGQPMLAQGRLVLMWPADINHTSERACVQLIEVASTISVSASDASEIALVPGCAHLQRGGMDSGATFPHAIDATTLMGDERSSGGSEGWRKSGSGAESWGEATAAVSYAGLGRAVDTPGMRGWQALVAMAKAEGGSGKVLAGTVGERNDLGYSSLGYDIDRLELPGYRVDGRVVSVDITGRLATEAAMLLVSGADSDDTPVGGGLGYSDARRQGSLMVAITSPDDLDVDRKERSRYDARCDLQGMPTSESPTMPAAPQSSIGGWLQRCTSWWGAFARWCPHATLPRNPPLCGGIAAGGPACWGVCFTDAIGVAICGCRAGVGVGSPCWHAGGLGAREHSSSGDQPDRWCPHVTLPRNPPFCGGIATGSAECGWVCFTDATDRRSHEAQGWRRGK